MKKDKKRFKARKRTKDGGKAKKKEKEADEGEKKINAYMNMYYVCLRKRDMQKIACI